MGLINTNYIAIIYFYYKRISTNYCANIKLLFAYTIREPFYSEKKNKKKKKKKNMSMVHIVSTSTTMVHIVTNCLRYVNKTGAGIFFLFFFFFFFVGMTSVFIQKYTESIDILMTSTYPCFNKVLGSASFRTLDNTTGHL